MHINIYTNIHRWSSQWSSAVYSHHKHDHHSDTNDDDDQEDNRVGGWRANNIRLGAKNLHYLSVFLL